VKITPVAIDEHGHRYNGGRDRRCDRHTGEQAEVRIRCCEDYGEHDREDDRT
jgi:hypothetical protein